MAIAYVHTINKVKFSKADYCYQKFIVNRDRLAFSLNRHYSSLENLLDIVCMWSTFAAFSSTAFAMIKMTGLTIAKPIGGTTCCLYYLSIRKIARGLRWR